MTTTPKLSIIVPFRARYFEIINLYQHAVVSGAPCVGADWELIFSIPKASKSARASLDALAERDARVKACYPPRGAGPIDAWRTGLEAATGEYVFVVGSACAPINRLAEFMQFAQGDVDVVNGRVSAPDGGRAIGYYLSKLFPKFGGETAKLFQPRLMTRLAAEAVIELPKGQRFEGVAIADDSFHQLEMRYQQGVAGPARFLALDDIIRAAPRPPVGIDDLPIFAMAQLEGPKVEEEADHIEVEGEWVEQEEDAAPAEIDAAPDYPALEDNREAA